MFFGKDNEKIVRKLYESFNDRDVDGMMSILDDNVEFVDPARDVTQVGTQGFRDYFWGWLTPFPDGKIEVTNVLEGKDDWFIVEYVGRGAHTGPLVTEGGRIEPTGRRVEMRICDLVQVKGDKVSRYRTYYDMATMLNQLGLLPSALAA